MNIVAKVLEENPSSVLLYVSFWVEEKEYFWRYYISKRFIKIVNEATVRISPLAFQSLRDDIKRRHSFKQVQYAFRFAPERVSWDKP